MRMRKKKNGEARIAACSDFLMDLPCADSGALHAVFGNTHPVHLEIGCGKGNFACTMAQKHPEINFIALERVSDVCCVALEKAKGIFGTPTNLRFVIADAKSLAELLPPHSVECIYLNFSDPWPKAGHAKRRLTYKTFLDVYSQLLSADGVLKFKTDNEGLFEFSLEQFDLYGAEVIFKTDDLHNTELAADNVMTEYEKNFSDRGMPIHSAWVRFSKKESDNE
ncbi:MAG: tRNA (guanosine(46)-N7)-methyltransferase TrmB [Eubacteriales bacterium]